MTRMVALLLSLVALALGLAACGGDDGGGGGSDGDAQAVLKETFGPDKPIKSGKLDLALNLDLKGVQSLSGPIDLRLAGPFQSNGAGTLPDFRFNLDLGTGGQRIRFGAVSTGDAGYLTVQEQAFDIGKDLYASFKKGYEDAQKRSGAKTKDDAPSLSALGIDPMRWLRDPRDAGSEDIGGTDTTHVAAQIDVPRFLQDLNRLLERGKGLEIQGAGKVPEPLSKEQLGQIERAVKSAKVDIWTGAKDRTLRRLRLDVALDVPEDTRDAVGGLQSGRITFNLTITALNEPQRIAAPRDARPLTELTQALEQLGGAAGGAAAGAQQGGGTSTTPEQAAPQASSGAQQQYFDCVAQAGTDVAKLQDCAALLK